MRQKLYFAIRKSGNYLFVENLCTLLNFFFNDKSKKKDTELVYGTTFITNENFYSISVFNFVMKQNVNKKINLINCFQIIKSVSLTKCLELNLHKSLVTYFSRTYFLLRTHKKMLKK